MNKLVKYAWNYIQICMCLLIPISVIVFGPSTANTALTLVTIIVLFAVGMNITEMINRRKTTQIKEQS